MAGFVDPVDSPADSRRNAIGNRLTELSHHRSQRRSCCL